MEDVETRGESTVASRPEGAAAAAAEPARCYTEAVLCQRHSQLFDLIPTRCWTNLVLLGLLLSAVTGLEALYGSLALSQTHARLSTLPAIDLGQRGSVATWLSAVMLLICAGYGVLTYRIRRHRADDYRGRYRMWCWVVSLLVVASIDQVAGLQETVRTLLLHVAGIPDYPDAMLAWVGAVLLLTAAFGTRLIIEMRACRVASLLVLLAVAALATIGCAQVGWLLPEAGIFRTMTLSALALVAQVMLLMAILLNLRLVHREALGQVPANRTPARKAVAGGSRQAVAQPRAARVDKGHQASQAADTQKRPPGRQAAGQLTRIDPAHEPAVSPAPQPAPATETGRAQNPGPPQQRTAPPKAKQRVTAKAAVEAPTPARKTAPTGSRCEPDDDQVDEAGRQLSKAERKRLRKQRRHQPPG